MKLLKLKKKAEGNYLKLYRLTYKNRAGCRKKYEIVSRHELHCPSDIGSRTDGVAVIVLNGDRMLLLSEFRMAANRTVFGLCEGMLEAGETEEQCARRELFEETGLRVSRMERLGAPSFSAPGISDTKMTIFVAEAEGEPSDGGTSPNEEICAAFYTRSSIRRLLKEVPFTTRAQLAAYWFLTMDD